MKKLLMFAFAATVAFASCSRGEILEMLVGTYTYDGGAGLYVLDFNTADASWVLRDSAVCGNASYLVRTPDDKFVYAVNEFDAETASVEAFAKDGYKLTSLGRQRTFGGYPCFVDTNGDLLLAANYTGGTMCVYPLKDGAIQPMSQEIRGTIGGPDLSRCDTPHVHCSIFTPEGKYVFATDFSADRIMCFDIAGDTLSYRASYPVEPDTGPRHIAFSPDGTLACVIGELSGKITLMSYNDGALETLDTAVCDTLGARGSADVRFSPDGRFIYASNRLAGDGIAIFKVDAAAGRLEKVAYQLTVEHPRNFSLSPDGKYLFCAGRDGNAVEIYTRDAETGLLTLTGSIPFVHPVFVRTYAQLD